MAVRLGLLIKLRGRNKVTWSPGFCTQKAMPLAYIDGGIIPLFLHQSVICEGKLQPSLLLRTLFTGNLDMKGVMRSVKKSDLEKVSIRNCEQLLKECKYQTKLVSQHDGSWYYLPIG